MIVILGIALSLALALAKMLWVIPWWVVAAPAVLTIGWSFAVGWALDYLQGNWK